MHDAGIYARVATEGRGPAIPFVGNHLLIQCYACFSTGGITMSAANKLPIEDWFREGTGTRRTPRPSMPCFLADGRSHGFPDADSVLVGPGGIQGHSSKFSAEASSRSSRDGGGSRSQKVIRLSPAGLATMTHLGDSLGIKATQKEVKLHGCTIAIIKDGMISEGLNFYGHGRHVRNAAGRIAASASYWGSTENLSRPAQFNLLDKKQLGQTFLCG